MHSEGCSAFFLGPLTCLYDLQVLYPLLMCVLMLTLLFWLSLAVLVIKQPVVLGIFLYLYPTLTPVGCFAGFQVQPEFQQNFLSPALLHPYLHLSGSQPLIIYPGTQPGTPHYLRLLAGLSSVSGQSSNLIHQFYSRMFLKSMSSYLLHRCQCDPSKT